MASLETGASTSGGSTTVTGASESTAASADTTGTTVAEGPSTDGPVFDVGTGHSDLGGGRPEGPVIPATCDQAEAGVSTVGCVFFGVDLDQNGGLEFDQYAIAVSNPQPGADANVAVEQKVGGVWAPVATQLVSPLTLFAFPLPDKHHQGSGVMEGGSYRVSSDVPIVAYQFNPLIQGAASSDASLLYPVSTWDTLNRAVHWGGGYGRGYLTVVAGADDTTIEVIPTVATAAGPGVAAGAAGVPFEITLQEGDIAEIMVAADNTALGGTRIEGDKPIGVFSGHECAWIPHLIPACDHIEDQLSGVRLWGNHFVASRMPIRETNGIPEDSLWQVVASEDNTTVTFTANAEVTGVPAGAQNIDAGGVIEFYAGGTAANPGDFLVDANKPIALANYMIGEANLVTSTLGDPAMVQLSPVEQYLPRYILLVPSEWELDFFVVTRPSGANITIDGVGMNDADFISIGGGYEVARVPTVDGVHALESDVGFMVTVVGYDSADSYAYIGGTGTGVINPNPEG
ncbi:MAG: IgGFc-binding protein [Deltaproteobacteria bacterium]|nr:IgGFc-binding protein [Nannocystaceae bacterium]